MLSHCIFSRLKGSDSIVFESAKLLKLPVHVKPFLDHQGYHPWCSTDTQQYALKNFSYEFSEGEIYEGDCEFSNDKIASTLFGDNVCTYDTSDITWCQQWKFGYGEKDVGTEPRGVLGYYGGYCGNEVGIDVWYSMAVILIEIPRWGDRCSVSDQEYKTTAGNMVEKCFKDIN